MSEQQNVALIQKVLVAFGRGDVQAILDDLTTDCEFYCPGPSIVPYTGTKKGKSEVQAYFDALINTQSNANLNIDRFVAQDEAVVAIGRYTATVKSSGKPIDTPVMLSFQIQDGKISRHMVLGDTAAVADGYRGA